MPHISPVYSPPTYKGQVATFLVPEVMVHSALALVQSVASKLRLAVAASYLTPAVRDYMRH
jgi:hypothetical protein